MSVLRRIEGERFSEVEPAWVGRAVAILAGGPSVSQDDARMIFDRGLGARVIAVNDAYLLAPFADVCYFADSRWWAWHEKGVARSALGLDAAQVAARFESFIGQKCSIEWAGSNIKDERVHVVRGQRALNGDAHGGWSTDRRRLASGRCSGYQALNLAVLAGARVVLLLGFDGKPDYASGRGHWFGEHPVPTLPQAYEDMRKMFAAGEREIAKSGVRVINCSSLSEIGFEKLSLRDALKEVGL